MGMGVMYGFIYGVFACLFFQQLDRENFLFDGNWTTCEDFAINGPL